MRPFPDHWEKNPIAVIIPIRLRFPLVRKKSTQEFALASLSRAIAARISENSRCTNSLSGSSSP